MAPPAHHFFGCPGLLITFYLLCPALFNYFNPFIFQCLALFSLHFPVPCPFFLTHIFLLIPGLPRVGNWDGFRAIWPVHYWISCESYEWSSLTWIKILLFLFLSIRALMDCHNNLDKFNYLESIVYLSFVHDCVELCHCHSECHFQFKPRSSKLLQMLKTCNLNLIHFKMSCFIWILA